MINELCAKAHKNAKDKGFFDSPKNVGEMIALMHSELSEALEADREAQYCQADASEIVGALSDSQFKSEYEASVKGTFEEEMADICIRVFDMCGWKGIDLEAHVSAKMRYNSLRGHKHGKKY